MAAGASHERLAARKQRPQSEAPPRWAQACAQTKDIDDTSAIEPVVLDVQANAREQDHDAKSKARCSSRGKPGRASAAPTKLRAKLLGPVHRLASPLMPSSEGKGVRGGPRLPEPEVVLQDIDCRAAELDTSAEVSNRCRLHSSRPGDEDMGYKASAIDTWAERTNRQRLPTSLLHDEDMGCKAAELSTSAASSAECSSWRRFPTSLLHDEDVSCKTAKLGSSTERANRQRSPASLLHDEDMDCKAAKLGSSTERANQRRFPASLLHDEDVGCKAAKLGSSTKRANRQQIPASLLHDEDTGCNAELDTSPERNNRQRFPASLPRDQERDSEAAESDDADELTNRQRFQVKLHDDEEPPAQTLDPAPAVDVGEPATPAMDRDFLVELKLPSIARAYAKRPASARRLALAKGDPVAMLPMMSPTSLGQSQDQGPARARSFSSRASRRPAFKASDLDRQANYLSSP